MGAEKCEIRSTKLSENLYRLHESNFSDSVKMFFEVNSRGMEKSQWVSFMMEEAVSQVGT